jgi:GrpB-like predicted nucleotidyltransferase (UPF0157 family)
MTNRMESERRPVALVPPDPTWPARAAAEGERLAGAIGPTLVVVHHIGSTAIPGIKAKATIDLLPVVHSLAELDNRTDAVRALGYDWRGEFGLPGRRFCTLTEGPRRLFNVHIYQADDREVDRHLAFRDYLRTHPDEARAYEAEKVRAAALRPDDVLAYNDHKNNWIKACEQRALAWSAIEGAGAGVR